MRLYSSIGPNPRVVTMFLAEKGVAIDTVTVDVVGGENRREPYLAKNPTGGTPMLELDDGRHVSESLAICEYLEELHPTPALIGTTAEARATTRMWLRRIDLGYVQPFVHGFRGAEGLPFFKDRTRCVPEGAEGMKAIARDGLPIIDAQLAGRDFICGDGVSLADLLLFVFMDFAAQVGQATDPGLANLAAWHARIAERPSASA